MSKHTTLDQLKLAQQRAKSEVDKVAGRVSTLENAGYEANVIETVKVNGTALTPDADKAVDITVPSAPAYSIAKDTTSSDYAAVYHLTKDGVNTGAAINIPKDMVVQSGEVVTYTADNKPTGVAAAGTYIKLVLQNVEAPLYINVGDLIEYVTSGSAETDMIVVAVDGTSHQVTATITDGTITEAKLAQAVQNKLNATYTHPSYTAQTSGFYKVTVDATGHVSAVTAVTKDDITGLGIPGQDTTYSEASQSAAGLMSADDKKKLDGFTEATDAEVTAMLNEVWGTPEEA